MEILATEFTDPLPDVPVGLDDAARERQPHAGRVFSITGLGVRGIPCEPYRGTVCEPYPGTVT